MERLANDLKILESIEFENKGLKELVSQLVEVQNLSHVIERAKIVSLGSGSDDCEQLQCYAARIERLKSKIEGLALRKRELSSSQGERVESDVLMGLVPPKTTYSYVEDLATEPSFPQAPSSSRAPTKEPISYWNYILPRELCDHMHRHSDNHDEFLFVRVHQIFELWFNQVLFELGVVRARLIGDQAPAADADFFAVQANLQRVMYSLRRSDAILRHATSIFDILETMDPSDFLDFRDYLGNASGFQSTQYRELELFFGLSNQNRPKAMGQQWEERFLAEGCPVREQRVLEQRRGETTLREAVEQWLLAMDIPHCAEFARHFLDVKRVSLKDDEKQFANVMSFFFEVNDADYYKVSPSYTKNPRELEFRRRALFAFTWREHPRWAFVSEILSTVQHIELAITIWRHRHARLVEYMIGRRIGTGGSSGVAYLDASTGPSMRVFGDIVRVRGEAISQHKLKSIGEDGFWKPN